MNKKKKRRAFSPITRILRRIIIAKLGDNIRERIVLPADKDIPLAVVAIDNILDTLRIVAVA